jgi:double-GTPase-like protein
VPESESQETAAEKAESPSKYIDLPKGAPLDFQGASLLLRARLTPIVLLVGAARCGKTTLLASLHDSFQRGTFAGYSAAGSETLLGFEERCFDSRITSGAEKPTTLRTSYEVGQQYYHLRVRRSNGNEGIRNLLLADMSGEWYDRAIDSAAEVRELAIIRRADHFVHLIDGAKLQANSTRAHIRSNALMLMRRCFEEEMLRSNARVDVLLTKWDVAIRRAGNNGAQQLLNEYQDLFANQYGDKVSRLRVIPIAARPHFKSELALAFGLSEVFQDWVEDYPQQLRSTRHALPAPIISRPFDTFALCYAKEDSKGTI